jgi:thymidylate kinase
MDGSGKSSLATFTRKLCEEHKQHFTLIGRKETYASPLAGRITRLLHEEAPSMTPQTESFMRIAREYERADLAVAPMGGVVVLDRFVLSSLSLIRFHGLDVEPITAIFKDLIARAHLHATVFVKCPFDVARNRVKERAIGGKRSRDAVFLLRLAEFMEEEFDRGVLTGQQWPVDNSTTLQVAEQQVADYLLPYIQKT